MRYFNIEDWIADQGDDIAHQSKTQASVASYRSYLAEIHPSLPEQLRFFLKTICIHDAGLLALEIDSRRRTLILNLAAGDITMREARYVRLFYEDLESFAIPRDPPAGLRFSLGGGGFGDLGFDELERLTAGFEHRVLFASGVELHIRFGRFRFELLDEPEVSRAAI